MKKRKNMIALWIGIIGGISAIISAIYQYVEKRDEEKEKIVQQQKAEEYQTKFENLLLEQKDSISEVKQLNEELLESERKNSRLTDELNKYIIGGDGIPRIQLITRQQTDGKFTVTVIITNDDKHPLHQVECYVRDWDGRMAFKRFHVHNFGIISGGASAPTLDISNISPTKESIYMDINIRWTRGEYKYIARLANVENDGNWDVVDEEYIYKGKRYKRTELFPNTK